MKTNNSDSRRGAPAAAPGQDRLVSKVEAASICGGISTRTLEREAAAGKLPKVKVRGRALFRLSDVLRLAKLMPSI